MQPFFSEENDIETFTINAHKENERTYENTDSKVWINN